MGGMTKFLVLAVMPMALLPGCGSGEDVVWACGDNIRLEVNASGNKASVTIGGIKQIAVFEPEGIYSRWVFGKVMDDGRFPFIIRVWPDGKGGYYDFSGTDAGDGMDPKSEFRCERQ